MMTTAVSQAARRKAYVLFLPGSYVRWCLPRIDLVLTVRIWQAAAQSVQCSLCHALDRWPAGCISYRGYIVHSPAAKPLLRPC